MTFDDLSLFSPLLSLGLFDSLRLKSFVFEVPLLVTIGDDEGVVGAGESGGGVAVLQEGLDNFLAFFTCLVRILSSSSDEGQVPEFL